MDVSSSTPVEIFYAYAHADASWRNALENHLSLLQRQGLISHWSDRHILPGTDWAQAIDEHLERASIILLLISADFLASNYCYGIEMQRALERHQADEARVIPILLRPVDWKGAPFAHLQALPTDAKPITSWRNRDAAFRNVAAGIRRVIEDLSLLQASAPRASLPSVWNIPYQRNSLFVGREALLAQLRQQLQAGQSTALSQPQAISGLGGIGKTQLAVEYAYRFHQDYQVVLWAHAATTETLTSSYVSIASLLNLPESEAQEQAITVQAVKTWLQTHSGWLLILDNADDLALIPAFLPPVLGGHLLLTTRAQAMGRLARPIEVKIFSPEDGALLLLRRAALLAPDISLEHAATSDIAAARAICEDLGGLPLALDQAGAYIEETQCGLADYQRQYQTRRAELLARRGGLIDDHPESVATTWSISFQKVEAANVIAADLLRACAFLTPDEIPEEVVVEALRIPLPTSKEIKPEFTERWEFSSVATGLLDGVVVEAPRIPLPTSKEIKPEVTEGGEYSSITAGQLDEAVALLRRYSLVQRNPQKHLLSIHRLVQAVLQEAMEEAERLAWAKRLVLACWAVLPRIFANWDHEYWDHKILRKLSGQYVLHPQVFMERVTPTFFTVSFRANYLREPSLEEEQVGASHLDTIDGLNNLAAFHGSQGRYEDAEPLYLRALSMAEEQLGTDHPDTAAILNNLAELYRAQGRYEEAEPLFQRALHTAEEQLGADHPQTAASLNNLAELYRVQDRYEEAEPLFQRALSVQKKQLGTDHPDTANSMDNLAKLYQAQGRYKEAEPLFQRARSIREERLGASHPNTAASLGNLGAFYLGQGRYEEAEPLLKRALLIIEEQLGTSHPDTATSQTSLATLYVIQGRYEEAEPLYQGARAIREEQLGPSHPLTVASLNDLAGFYVIQGRYKEAEPLYQRELSIREERLEPSHPDTATCLNSLATLYQNQSRYEEAEPLYQRALSIREEQLGSSHPLTAASLNNLALLYQKQNRYEDAEPLYQRALSIAEEQLGASHSQTVASLNNLAELYERQGRYEEAEPLYQRALHTAEEQLGASDPLTATILNNLAVLYEESQGRYKDAEPMYRRALSIREERLGPSHPDTIDILNNLAALYQNQGRYEEAEPLYQRAAKVSVASLGMEHSKTQQMLWNHATILSHIYTNGDFEALLQLLEKGEQEEPHLRNLYTSISYLRD